MPPLSPERIALHLTPTSVRAIRRGHPWVYADTITKQNRDAPPGALAVLFDNKRRFVGIGLYDPESPIRVRVLQANDQVTIDHDWLHTRLATAINHRAPLIADPHTTGYRLIHGENDYLPGLVVDRYADTLVIKLDTAAWLPHLTLLTTQLTTLTSAPTHILRLSRTVLKSAALPPNTTDGTHLAGPPLPNPHHFLENGITFEVDPIHGQKTGFFLDQRHNRAHVQTLAKNKHVLNVFAYTGGFSLYAARGGATTVTSLDLNAPALAAATANVAHNQHIPQIAATTHHTICGDAFTELENLATDHQTYDLVILDPPSFARKQTDINGALQAYTRLATLGLAVLKPRGTLVAASCSSRITAEDFYTTIHNAANQANRPLTELKRTTHAPDHPINFPQGAYLKCLYAKT